ncbi:hypothetical protein DRO47_04570 [Candidatus Bathyarchaeota archaeon]|nr:MAG: hypothetical protein DRO47_04570 [Candidatus Bathyarchaeota archaeon]
MASRRSSIDSNVHHACAFLYAMMKSGLQPVEALNSLSEHRQVYGAIAEELGIAVKRVKYLGESLTSALRYIASTTSSKSLRELIDGFITATRQSLTPETYFKIKFEEFFEVERKNKEATLRMMSLIGEFAVVLVALTPTLVLTTGLSLGVLNPEVLNFCNLYMIVIMPLSAIGVLLYIRAVCPAEEGASVTKVAFPIPLLENVSVKTEDPKKDVHFLDSKDKWILFKSSLKRPLNLFFTHPSFVALLSFLILATLMSYFLLSGTTPEKLTTYTLLGSCIILAVLHEVRFRYVRSLERRIPDFLRGLAEAVEREGSILRAIELVLKSRLGLLGREIRRISATRLGVPLKQALLMIEYRTASPLLKRVLSLLAKASESTRNLKDILMMAADDSETYVRLRRDRYRSLIGYAVSTYVCFIVYVYVYWIMKNQFLTSLSGVSGFLVSPMAAEMAIQGYYIALFLGVVLGLTVGAVTEGSILSGLKHSIVMVTIAIALLGWSP